MDFEWDENKRNANLQKHFLDFIDAPVIFYDDHITGSANMVDGEVREIATGRIDDVLVTVVFTRRSNAIRIISLRRASHGERRRYQEVFGI